MTGRRILVVDDDHGMVETLADILELHGWETIKAYDGAQAIKLSQEEDVDVVLMDIRMPRVNGADALRAIKAARPTLPVVLITAIAAQELLTQAEQDGALRILKKPLDLKLLLSVLDGAASAT
jgi:DNA-binding NtrC family response regulator